MTHNADTKISRIMLFRLSLPTLLVSAVLLTLGGSAAWYVQWLQADSTTRINDNLALIRATEEFDLSLRESRSHLRQFLLDGDRSHFESISWLQLNSQNWIDEIHQLAKTQEEKAELATIRQDHERILLELEALRRDKGQSPRELRERITQLTHAGLFDRILTPTHELLKSYEERSLESSHRIQALNQRVSLVMLLLGVCGAVSGLLVGLSVARSIGQSILNLKVPIHDAAGKLSQMVGPVAINTGATIEETQQSLEELSKQIEKVIERLQLREREVLRGERLAAIGQLAAGFAHELRNPLTSIKILVQSSVDASGTGTLAARDVGILEEEFLRLEKLIQSFLDFARPPYPKRQRVDLWSLVEQSVRLASPRAEQQGSRIEARKSAKNTMVEIDSDQMKQVLLNLILNGLDAIGRDGVLTVDLRDEANDVVVEVRDTGPGISEEVESRMFDPFFSTKEAGTGLGLAICRRIVESHNGTITARNCPGGGGASLEFRLPRTSERNENA